MSVLQIIFALVSMSCLCRGQVDVGECSSPDLIDNDFLFGVINSADISVNHDGIIYAYDMVNTVGVTQTSTIPSNAGLTGYLTARYVETTGRLEILITDALREYEITETAASIRLTIELACSIGTRRLVFEQPLADENNHAPVFGQDVYEFEVQLPLPRDFDLTFFQSVYARDLDILNNRVQFTSTNAEGVTVGTKQLVGDDGKTFYASLVTSHQMLSVGEGLEFTITATDSGTPPLQSTAQVVVRANAQDVFIPVPKFGSAFYRGTIDSERQLVIGPLTITFETYHEEIALGFSGDDASLFGLTNEEHIITIALQRALTDSDLAGKTMLMTTLVANRADVDRGATVIIVDVPQIPVPQFEQLIYSGTLNSGGVLNVPDLRVLTETYVPELTFAWAADNDERFFRFERNENAIRITLDGLLPIDLQFRTYFRAEVLATRQITDSEPAVGRAVLLVDVETIVTKTPALKFEKSFYSGQIVGTDRQLLIETLITLDSSTYSSDVVFRVEGNDADIFQLVVERNVISVQLARAVSDADMQKRMLRTTIWADRRSTTDDTSSGSTELVVAILEPIGETTQAPQFTYRTYVGSIDSDLIMTIPTITLFVDTFTDDVLFTLIGDTTLLFVLSNEGNAVTLTQRRELIAADVQNKSYLKFIIQATNNRLLTDETVLIVDIEQSDNAIGATEFSFEKWLYIGRLDDDRKLTLETISIVGDSIVTDVEFELVAGDSNLFAFNRPDTNSVDVGLAQDLTDADLEGKQMLYAVLKATRRSSGFAVGVGMASIMVRIAESEFDDTQIPKFERTFYMGTIGLADGALVYELVPKLSETQFNAEVVFSLTGDDSAIFTITNEQDVIHIDLEHELTEVEKLKPIFHVTIVATSTNGRQGTTEFVVIQEQRSNVEKSLVFVQPVYTGSIGVDGKLTTFPLMSLTGSDQVALNFALIDADSPLIIITAADNVVTLTLSRDLTDAELRLKPYLKARLVATDAADNTISGTTIIIIDVAQPSPIAKPQFLQDVYHGYLDAELMLTFEDVRILSDTFTDDVTLTLRDDDSAMFKATRTLPGVINIELNEALTETAIADRTYLTTVLSANRPDVGESSALLLVNIQLTTPRPAIPQPQFGQPVYRGHIDANLRLEEIEDVALVASTFTTGMQFRLVGEDAELFTFNQLVNVVYISLRDGLTSEQLNDKDFLSFRVDASHPETTTTSAGVLIDIPPKKCPFDETPLFDNLEYSLALTTSTAGRIGQIRARVPSDDGRSLQYGIGTIDAALSGRLVVDASTGDLSLTSTLVAGQYSAQVKAIDPSTTISGSATIRLVVTAVLTCPPDAAKHVTDLLLIRYLIENQEHSDIGPGTIEDGCEYLVVKSVPDDRVYVRMDAESKTLATIQLDREADIFDGMAVPQVQVTLQLICDGDDNVPTTRFDTRRGIEFTNSTTIASRSLDPSAEDGRWYALTESLPYAPRVTQLTIIIEDVNDNAPQFVQPIVDEMLYGYPEPQLAEAIMPGMMIQVNAIDRDAGLNAQVRYRLDANAHFQINDETGVITPVRNTFADGVIDVVTLNVHASDRDGAADGLTTSRRLSVRKLTADNIAVITVQDRGLDDVELIVDRVYREKSVELMVLHAARVSLASSISRHYTARQTVDNEQVNVLRMFVYSVRDNVEIIESSALLDVLRDFDSSIYELSALRLTDYELQPFMVNIGSFESNLLTMLVLSSVLGILLLLSCLGTFLLWWYKIRPYSRRTVDDAERLSSARSSRINSEKCSVGFGADFERSAFENRVVAMVSEPRPLMLATDATSKSSEATRRSSEITDVQSAASAAAHFDKNDFETGGVAMEAEPIPPMIASEANSKSSFGISEDVFDMPQQEMEAPTNGSLNRGFQEDENNGQRNRHVLRINGSTTQETDDESLQSQLARVLAERFKRQNPEQNDLDSASSTLESVNRIVEQKNDFDSVDDKVIHESTFAINKL